MNGPSVSVSVPVFQCAETGFALIYRVNFFAYLDDDSADKTCALISASGVGAEEF